MGKDPVHALIQYADTNQRDTICKPTAMIVAWPVIVRAMCHANSVDIGITGCRKVHCCNVLTGSRLG